MHELPAKALPQYPSANRRVTVAGSVQDLRIIDGEEDALSRSVINRSNLDALNLKLVDTV
jgi:hypothetical protein